MPPDCTRALRLLYDWQTLIAGALAVLAAGVAAFPVWRQLTSMKVQSAVMARETLTMRLTAIESRRDFTRKKVQSITREFMGQLHPYDDHTEPDIHPEWAHGAEQTVGAVITSLLVHQESSLDGEPIDEARRALIVQAEKLAACLSDIHTPYSRDLSDPEYNLTEEEITARSAAASAAAERAEGELDQQISMVGKGGEELDAAFKGSLDRLRTRIRQIDVLVSRGDRGSGF